MQLPSAFVSQMQTLIGSDYSDFEAALRQRAPTSIRAHPTKAKQEWSGERVAWHPTAYYLNKRPIFTLDPSFHAGAYYVQEASSMFVGEAMRQLVNLNERLKVLDLCAAPGGKSTLLLSMLNEKSFLLSNEVVGSRYAILQENLAKWGRSNVAVSNHDPKDFQVLEGFFDVVLVDAPCSGEGLFRKNPKAIKEWSLEVVAHCAARQKRILAAAQDLVKKGGILIYCTCTYNGKENDENVKWLKENYDLTSLQLEVPAAWKITERQVADCYGYQFFPHRTKGEGFFLTCLRKNDAIVFKTKDKKKEKSKNRFEKVPKSTLSGFKTFVQISENYGFLQAQSKHIYAIPKVLQEDFNTLSQAFRRIHLGTEIGIQKGKSFIPAAPLAMSDLVHPDLPQLALSKEQALYYLKKLAFEYETHEKGWHWMTYEGSGLGWAKILKHRMNNYYPKNWRIRMEINH